MRKIEEMRNPASCWAKARAESRLFVIGDWDAAAARTIRCWAIARIEMGLNKEGDAQITEARALADAIEKDLAEVKAARAARAAQRERGRS